MNQLRRGQPQLVHWYRRFLDDGRSAAFVSMVACRYSVSTLGRMALSTHAETRRAAVLALGMLGGAESIPIVGELMKDSDRCVRLVAEVAFSDLSRRAMGCDAEQRLALARRDIDGGRYDSGLQNLETLLSEWPTFAEAWYQRGIAHYCIGEYEISIGDAQHGISLSPYHYPCLTLRGRCYLELQHPADALRSFRKSLSINPSQVWVQGTIEMLNRQQRRLT